MIVSRPPTHPLPRRADTILLACLARFRNQVNSSPSHRLRLQTSLAMPYPNLHSSFARFTRFPSPRPSAWASPYSATLRRIPVFFGGCQNAEAGKDRRKLPPTRRLRALEVGGAEYGGKSTSIKPTHKAIKTYYQTLQTYRDERVDHEGATETAFQQLLADTARSHGWTLLPKLKLQVKGSARRGSPDSSSARRGSPDPAATKNIYPDGTLHD